MTTFIQLHLLTSYPPANLNRDDMGRPKTCTVGGAERLRISSQSLKRAWRTSEVWENGLAGHVGTRTKEMGAYIFRALTEGRSLQDILARSQSPAALEKLKEKPARDAAKAMAAVFGKLDDGKGDTGGEGESAGEQDAESKTAKDLFKDLKLKQLAHFSPEEITAISELTEEVRGTKATPRDEALHLLRKNLSAADIALFGRMLADASAHNVEAACQVAHAFSVQRVLVEDDFFTAEDDLNRDDMGAGHMGVTEFGAGLFYLYVCVDRDLLAGSLGGNKALADKALAALAEAMATVAPTGKQNSFASRAYASYVLAEKGSKQPRSLSVAFLDPITGPDMLGRAIEHLDTARANMDAVYGPCADAHAFLNAATGQGSLRKIIDFIIGG